MSARLIPMTRKWSERFGLALSLAAFGLAAALQGADWEKLPPLPEPNGGFACGTHHGHVVVAGGTNWAGGEKRWLSAVHEFDPEQRRWQTQTQLASPVAYGVAGTGQGTFRFAGGYTGTAGFDGMVQIEGHGQRVIGKGLPAGGAVVLAAGGAMGNQLIFSGGTSDPGNLAGLTRNTFTLGSSGELERCPDYPGKGFGIAGSVTAGDSLYIFGGAVWAGINQDVINSREAYAFSMGSKTWRRLRDFPYAARGLAAVVLDDGRLYVAGGYKNDAEGFTGEAFVYDIARDQYAAANPLPYKAMVGLVNGGGFIYCLGGEDRQKSRTDACFRIPISALLR